MRVVGGEQTTNVDLRGGGVTVVCIVPSQIDFIAASFVRKAQDVVNIRSALGEAAGRIQVPAQLREQCRVTPAPFVSLGMRHPASSPVKL